MKFIWRVLSGAVPAIIAVVVTDAAAVAQNRLPPCSDLSIFSVWNNCQGERVYNNGARYVGEYKDGKRGGHGTLTYTNGDVYVGEFKDGNFDGNGTYIFSDGDKYAGEFKEGAFGSKMSVTYANGDKYVGDIKSRKRDGQGTLTLANGEKYVGEFKLDKMTGKGTFTTANQEKYVGDFKDGKRDGEGTLYARRGAVSATGLWVDDKYVGSASDFQSIKMEIEGGVFVVPIRLNDAITLNAIIDSGASDVSVPADIVLTLIRTKTLSTQDFLGKQIYTLADGSKVPSQQFIIRSMKVGSKTVENVVASIASAKAEILLGQSFLGRFKSWSVDNEKHVLILK